MYSFILINQPLIFKHHLAFSLFFKLIFNGRIIDLQCCVGFCHTMMWISHKYTYVSSLLNLPPRTYPIPSFCIATEYQIELPVLYSNFALPTYFTYGDIYVSMLFSQFIPPSPSPAMSRSLFSMSVSLFLPCKYIHQYHFSRFSLSVYINIQYFFSSFWLTALCITGSRFFHLTGSGSNAFLFMVK